MWLQVPLNSIVPRKFPWTLSNSWVVYFISCNKFDIQNQSTGGVLRKSRSKNIQQIYKRLPMPKCDLKKFAKKIYWSHISAWVFSCKFGVYFRTIFYKNISEGLLLIFPVAKQPLPSPKLFSLFFSFCIEWILFVAEVTVIASISSSIEDFIF